MRVNRIKDLKAHQLLPQKLEYLRDKVLELEQENFGLKKDTEKIASKLKMTQIFVIFLVFAVIKLFKDIN